VLDLIPTKGAALVSSIALALLWVAESLAPEFVGRKHRVRHDLPNLALGLINVVLVAGAFSSLIVAVTEWAARENFGLVRWLRLEGPAAWLVALLLFDLWMYLWHVMNHKLPLLWRFHAMHHSDAELGVCSGVRFHCVEIALSSVARLGVLPLLGLSVPQLLLYESIALPIILFHHSNLRVPGNLDRILRCVIVTPWMHWVHHSRKRIETDSNYSSLLSIWDRLFRTFRLRQDPAKIVLGLDGYAPREWRSLSGMLAASFRRRSRGDRAGNAESACPQGADGYDERP